MKNSHKFFANKDCKYYPCHPSYSCHSLKDNFNCLFCFCPLYSHNNCGGNYIILSNGIKDCSNCLLPHNPNSYQYIINKMRSYNAM
ncbi:MAG: cysteine-rich small domain-containing protein [Candidatus Pacebacteria bacterium]|nr:cysteine-rich small domain-containing protein [Candidatus Paceibacterota bacterium]